jgi:hypothetical protein
MKESRLVYPDGFFYNIYRTRRGEGKWKKNRKNRTVKRYIHTEAR